MNQQTTMTDGGAGASFGRVWLGPVVVLLALLAAFFVVPPSAAQVGESVRASGVGGAGEGCDGMGPIGHLPRHRLVEIVNLAGGAGRAGEAGEQQGLVISFNPRTLAQVAKGGAGGGAGAVDGAGAPGMLIARARGEVGARKGAGRSGRFLLEDFPLSLNRSVTLDLQAFSILGQEAGRRSRIVLGQAAGGAGGAGEARGAGGDDIELPFDPESVLLLRGRVVEHAHSSVFLAYAEALGVMGWIELGPGEGGYTVSSGGMEWWRGDGVQGGPAPAGGLAGRSGDVRATVFRTRGGINPPLGVPMCGLNCGKDCHPEEIPPPQGSPHDEPIRRGLKAIELAVETDVDYYRLFDDLDKAGQYILVMYGAVSHILMREINCKLVVTYVRLWDQPSGLLFHTHSDPLPRFRNNWNNTMGSVQRATAQYFSGRRDLGWGGIAYLNGLCNTNAYSVVAYAQGSFASVDTPNVFSFDFSVAAHELGHNFNALHTHDYGYDQCHLANTPARRGTIMSYCSQTVSGGKAVQDLRFATPIRAIMRNYIVGRPCIYFDCNNNGIDDAIDIASGFSQDANNNGIPDECEDCNNNGILDSIDIATGFSLDLNNNGIPDECEPDCNNNNVPDDLDILLGTSQDLYMDGIPDECLADCNQSGTPDYHEIMADMSRDIDRDAVLDECQRCDGITPDLVALDGAHNVWLASTSEGGPVREVHALTGVVYRQAPLNHVTAGQDLVVSPRHTVLVSSAGTNSIVEFDRAGAHIGTFVAPGAGTLSHPTGLIYGPNGNLFVSSRGNHRVLEYDGVTGTYLSTFVFPATAGLTQPFGLLFTDEGHLLVTSADDRVLEFDGQTGAFRRTVVSAGSGGLSGPRGMAMTSYGTLLVASFDTDALLEYELATGAFIRQFNRGGTATILTLDGPWGVRLGPDGHIYASRHLVPRAHVTTGRIFKYHGTKGILLGSFVQGNDSGIYAPTGFDWMPGNGIDCNRNLIPDHCDIASGFSRDRNNNGIPDECEGCYANCTGSTTEPLLTVDDFTCFINEFAAASALPPHEQVHHYANCDGSVTPPVLNVDDFTCFINEFAAGCP